ncbi:voltage-dependent calcium channel type D subunit alpha-1-like [Contarinia nasturtii]|uniref:voltage-dependent calcium channel type D subunit alpha-1-like n=1 Tax=Contarinia nasturtii TaxID=265458 RepID=UPI0012D392A3|nr:voltage-dependent calcium channel type D subunit alpha-1-like [Contarinia nasturtii]
MYQPVSDSYANSNGIPVVPVPVPSMKESADIVNFHANQRLRLTQSTPGSPQEHGRPTSFDVIGSAESLVGRVLVEQGLGKFCDPDFIRYTSREMQEALNMTSEEMDMAAHQLILQNHLANS